ncbi:hypothetical protein NADFUDRAFT_84575, partial [Nadsonia fulvescens var. elongata DSM 6958]
MSAPPSTPLSSSPSTITASELPNNYTHPKEYEDNKLLKLLVAQHAHSYGDSPASFDKIVEALNCHPLLIEQFANKHNDFLPIKSENADLIEAETGTLALQKSDIMSLYEYMLRTNDLHPSTHPCSTPTPTPISSQLPVPAAHISSTAQRMSTPTPTLPSKKYITQLAQLMYMDYSEELLEDLTQLETRFKKLVGEVDQIQSGSLDQELRAKYTSGKNE